MDYKLTRKSQEALAAAIRQATADGNLGALLATVEVTVPHDLNSKARSALEDLRIATAGTDPREELLRKARQD